MGRGSSGSVANDDSKGLLYINLMVSVEGFQIAFNANNAMFFIRFLKIDS